MQPYCALALSGMARVFVRRGDAARALALRSQAVELRALLGAPARVAALGGHAQL